MKVEEIQSGKTLVLVVYGRVDLSTVAEFETRLAGWTRPGTLKALVLDTTELTYVASRGLRAMLQAFRELTSTSGRFILCGPTENVRSLLEMTGFDQVFEIHDTRATALAALENLADTDD